MLGSPAFWLMTEGATDVYGAVVSSCLRCDVGGVEYSDVALRCGLDLAGLK